MKRNKYFTSLQTGFTLIELLVVFSIFFVATTAGTIAFNNYNTAQTLNSSSTVLIAVLNSAKTNAVTQSMPLECSYNLKKYSIKIIPPNTYQMLAYCNNISSGKIIKKYRLPAGNNFDTGAYGEYGEIYFNTGSGTSGGGIIKIKDESASKTIQIDTMGNITGPQI